MRAALCEASRGDVGVGSEAGAVAEVGAEDSAMGLETSAPVGPESSVRAGASLLARSWPMFASFCSSTDIVPVAFSWLGSEFRATRDRRSSSLAAVT